MKRHILIAFTIVVFGAALIFLPEAGAREPQESQDDLRKQIGTIIVTPGSGPSLAVADFQPRAGGLDTPRATFNETLWNDLKFAGVANLVGKSLDPKTLLADPATLRRASRDNDPVKSNEVAFGKLSQANSAIGELCTVHSEDRR